MKNKTIALRIEDELGERLKEIAHKKDVPVSQIIRELIREYLSQEVK